MRELYTYIFDYMTKPSSMEVSFTTWFVLQAFRRSSRPTAAMCAMCFSEQYAAHCYTMVLVSLW